MWASTFGKEFGNLAQGNVKTKTKSAESIHILTREQIETIPIRIGSLYLTFLASVCALSKSWWEAYQNGLHMIACVSQSWLVQMHDQGYIFGLIIAWRTYESTDLAISNTFTILTTFSFQLNMVVLKESETLGHGHFPFYHMKKVRIHYPFDPRYCKKSRGRWFCQCCTFHEQHVSMANHVDDKVHHQVIWNISNDKDHQS